MRSATAYRTSMRRLLQSSWRRPRVRLSSRLSTTHKKMRTASRSSTECSLTCGACAAERRLRLWPREVHGIDMEESQIGLAQSAAVAGGRGNATFGIDDVTTSPSPRGRFF